jgi:hypothetical protein
LFETDRFEGDELDVGTHRRCVTSLVHLRNRPLVSFTRRKLEQLPFGM